MGKRVFVGIPTSESVNSLIKNWSDKHLARLNLRIIAPENLHLTLIPPWNEKEVGIIYRKIGKIISFNPFTINFFKICFGPIPKRPRLIWLEGKESENLTQLKKTLERILDKRGEAREFLPHVTIARFRPADFQKFRTKGLSEKINFRQKIDRVCLFESQLSPLGARYKIIERFKLL